MRFLPAAFVIFILASFVTAQSSTIPRNGAGQQDLQDAEQLINRMMSQFGRTLDLRRIFKTMLVRDQSMRRLALQNGLRDRFDADVLHSLDTQVLEALF